MRFSYIDNNGNISEPQKLPNNWRNIINFKALSESELNQKGWYKYEVPVYDVMLQKLGELYFDDTNKVVTRYVIDKSFDLQTEKDKKINQLQYYVLGLLKSTDQYYIRKQERGIAVPDHIENERSYIHSKCDEIKDYINNETDVAKVVKYNFRLDDLKYHKIEML